MSLTKASYAMINGAVINVLDYGAKGDGVTDDTSSIQAAFNASTNGQYVYFPVGTYLTSSTLTFDCSFGGSTSGIANNANLSPVKGTVIKYTGTGTCFQTNSPIYGINVENFWIELQNTALIGIDIRFGGNLNKFTNIAIFANSVSTPCDYGVYLRGVNPDTNAPNYHQHYNKFDSITVVGNMLTGFKLGDDDLKGSPGYGDCAANANQINNFTAFLAPLSGTPQDIYLYGTGCSIVQPNLTNPTSCIRFFGASEFNSIIAGYMDYTVTTAVYIDADAGVRFIVALLGCNLSASKIVDSVEPSSAGARYTMWGCSYASQVGTMTVNEIVPITPGTNVVITDGVLVPWTTVGGQNPANVPINSIYKSNSDGKLYWKDSSGVSHALY